MPAKIERWQIYQPSKNNFTEGRWNWKGYGMGVKMGRKFLNLSLALLEIGYDSIWGLKALVLEAGMWFSPWRGSPCSRTWCWRSKSCWRSQSFKSCDLSAWPPTYFTAVFRGKYLNFGGWEYLNFPRFKKFWYLSLLGRLFEMWNIFVQTKILSHI